MQNSTKNNIAWVIRIAVAFLFLISAAAKMYPSPYFAISTFEVKQLYTMGFSEGFAPYFSRTLIGIELALGLLLLQRNYLRTLVVPATILMLVVFIVHLTIDTFVNGNSGSCGCFGELLPMTPVEAIIKNVISVAVLVWLFRLLPPNTDRKNFWVLTTVTLASVLFVFMLAPIQPAATEQAEEPVELPSATALPAIDTTATVTTEAPAIPTETPAVNAAAKPAADEPAQARSAYTQYFASVNKGKKIIGLFAPGCDHCRETAKELTQMRAKDRNFPELQIIFMDEETNLIPDFFKHAGAEYPYKVIDIISFWKLLGNSKDTPGVVYLWNGNIIKDWDGINEKQFKGADLQKLYKKPYSEIKK